jgi:GNAT superfamily N-acetyltransferase
MFGLFEQFSKEDPFIPQTPGSLLRQSRAGRAFNIRPLKQSDSALVAEFLSQLSANTLLNRFFVGRNSLSESAITEEIKRLYQVGRDKGSVLVATSCDPASEIEEIIGLGEISRDRNLYLMAEVALTVRDDFQGEGIGSALALQLVNEARKKGLTTLRAETLFHNQPMRRIWPKLGLPYSFQASHDVTIMLALLNP